MLGSGFGVLHAAASEMSRAVPTTGTGDEGGEPETAREREDHGPDEAAAAYAIA